MRIVHVSDCYAPRLGGIETQVRALAIRQAAAGHDVHVLTATASGDAGLGSGNEVIDGVRVHRRVSWIPFDLPVHPRVVSEVRALLADGGDCAGADAIHVHAGVISPFAYPAADVAASLGLPTVVTIHGVWGPLMVPVAAFADRLTHWSQWGVLATAVSEAAAEPLRRAAPGLDVRLLPNGIDTDAWQVTHVPAPDDTVRLLAVMRLAPRKRGMSLLRMMSAASGRMPERTRLHLRIVGAGPASRPLQRYAAWLGLADAVTFTGRVTPAQVRDHLATTDIFVAPATRESFGIAPLEARTAGVPVLAREGTGMESFIRDGVEGLLAADDNQLIDNIARLALDVPLREAIAAHNRTTRPEQDWAAVLPLVTSLYAAARTPSR